MDKTYIAIDLKSFYASVECVERGLDPLTTALVVADESRSAKTICLAASPAIKAFGVPGRARLFEVVQKVKAANRLRQAKAPKHILEGESCNINELQANPSLALSYIVAKPRMALYLDYSTRVYEVYLRYISADDIHNYSVDEVFMDVTPYLNTYHMTAHELARRMIREVLEETGITATVGIGTNLYLAKIAMDIVAKKMPTTAMDGLVRGQERDATVLPPPDKDGVRIAELDELSYRQKLWSHTPITDFWRVGKGYARKLREHGLLTMGDIARCSLGKATAYHNAELLYKLFGVNAELLIDHAWGWEPCTIEAIKAYRPTSSSLGSGQVLLKPYPHDKARLIVWEMTDLLVLDLVDKGLLTDQIVLDIGYDIENMKHGYCGEIHVDHYGRTVPKSAHGSVNLGMHTSSSKLILEAVVGLYERITQPDLLVRRVTVTANHVLDEHKLSQKKQAAPEQLDLFTDCEEVRQEQLRKAQDERKEKALQHAMLAIKHKYGKNAILKATNLQEDAMTVERNQQIGGHKA